MMRYKMEILLRFSGYSMEEVSSMSEMGVWRRWAAASSFWKETLGAIFGGLGLGGGSDVSAPSMPSMDSSPRSSSPFGEAKGSTSTPYNFPNA